MDREHPMRVVIFGATGATGRELVTRAVARRMAVTVFARHPSRLAAVDRHLQVITGDVSDPVAVGQAVEGQDAVLCALGAASPFRRDPTLVEGVGHIVEAMRESQTRRLVYLSFLGVREGRPQLSVFGRIVVARLLLRNVVADHEAKERIIRDSSLEWIIVRPPRLTNGPPTGRYRVGLDIRATSIVPRISRADLATFMVDQLTQDTYLRKAPAVMY